MNNQLLIKAARESLKHAYAPYSRFRVGAAVLTEKGKIFQGCNIENASYGLTVCAERVAIFNAIASGERHFKVMAITTSGKSPAYPCGACLQVLAEFAPELILIIVEPQRHPATYSGDNNKQMPTVISLRALLPVSFKLARR
ncbi:MAG: cytidine deaminase [Planctomycetes bacterium]|nr:cytidine deaminase [Planctomycetota bacterium]